MLEKESREFSLSLPSNTGAFPRHDVFFRKIALLFSCNTISFLFKVRNFALPSIPIMITCPSDVPYLDVSVCSMQRYRKTGACYKSDGSKSQSSKSDILRFGEAIKGMQREALLELTMRFFGAASISV